MSIAIIFQDYKVTGIGTVKAEPQVIVSTADGPIVRLVWGPKDADFNKADPSPMLRALAGGGVIEIEKKAWRELADFVESKLRELDD